MNYLSYNCRGLEKARAVVRLTNLVRREDPKNVFLMETKCERKRTEEVRKKLGFANCFTVDCVGKSGGLGLLWDAEINLSIQSYTCHHIDALISYPDQSSSWRFTGIYGWPNESEKYHTMELLKKLKEETRGEWLCVGDFNQILSLEDKQGGNVSSYSNMLRFRDTLEVCELTEIEFLGHRYTWDNARKETKFIQERLDFAFANEAWCEAYPGASVLHLDREGSDHVPVIIFPLRVENVESRKRSGKRPKRFEALRAADEGSEIIIRNAWNNPNVRLGEDGVMGKISRCMADLKKWDKTTFGDVLAKLRSPRRASRD